MSIFLPLALLAVQAAPTLPERFRDLAAAQDMVGTCAKLDPSPAMRARVSKARAAAAAVIARARATGRGADADRGQRDWSAMRDDVDTSCIVGPGETRRSAYADLVTRYEQVARDTRAALASTNKGR